MKRPKGRRIAIVITALGISTAAVAAFLLRGPIVEKWYLHQLEVGTAEEKLAAIVKLGDVGSEAALIGLHEAFLRNNPGQVPLGWIWEGGAASINLAGVFSGPHGDGDDGEFLRVISRIEQQLGKDREVASYLRMLKNESIDSRMRVYFCAHMILGTSDPHEIGDHSDLWDLIIKGDPSRDWRSFRRERADAIRSLITLSTSRDEVCRSASIIILGWCGPDAAAAVPGLKNATRDPNSFMQNEATEALKHIRGE